MKTAQVELLTRPVHLTHIEDGCIAHIFRPHGNIITTAGQQAPHRTHYGNRTIHDAARPRNRPACRKSAAALDKSKTAGGKGNFSFPVYVDDYIINGSANHAAHEEGAALLTFKPHRVLRDQNFDAVADYHQAVYDPHLNFAVFIFYRKFVLINTDHSAGEYGLRAE